jgi:mannose-6-phosphate isomerase-like protein (cupin superfamily)
MRSALPLVPFCLLAGTQVTVQDDKVVPVHREPRHRVVFETTNTRILDIQIPPGDTTLFHTHSEPILYVNMSTSQTRSQTLGREWSGGGDSARAAAAVPAKPPAPFRPGRMNSTTSYVQQPQTHRVNNVGQGLFRLIGITNSSAGDESIAASADFAATPEVDNRWFRGYRGSLTPNPSAEHRHANPVAIVLVSGRAVVSTASRSALDKPGAIAWIEANTPHRLQSAEGEAEIAEIEVRRPRR